MPKNGNSSFRINRAAWLVSIMFLLATGTTYRWLVSAEAGRGRRTSWPSGTLARLPMTIGQWHGEDMPLSRWVVRMSTTFDHISRNYIIWDDTAGSEPVSLFIGYGVRPRDLMPHRPDICYPVSGWPLVNRKVITLPAPGGAVIPCQLFHFQHGGFGNEHMAVLYYWIIDGVYYADIAGFRWRSLQPGLGRDHVIQVQIGARIQPDRSDPDAIVRKFAIESSTAILTLIKEARAVNPGLPMTMPTTQP